jgi:hypothetical protein
MEEYGTARQATDGSIIWCMHFTCRVNNNNNKSSVCVPLLRHINLHFFETKVV